MYQLDQIQEIVESKIEALKNAESKSKKDNKVLPEYTEVYKESVENLERISIHSEQGKFPEDLFKERAPNQTPDEFKYIKATYKNTTFPIWNRFAGFINRIWNDQNWSIKWPESKEGDSPQNYVEKEYPIFKSLEAYYRSIVTPIKEKDSMAAICHKPYYIPTKINDNNELVVDQTQRIKPVAYVYNAAQVVGFLEEEYILIELNEKSIVEWGNGKVKEGIIYEFFDRDNIWRIVQKGKKKDYKFDYILYYQHNLGYLPATKLKGIPHQKESDILWTSHFMAAVDTMDDIALDDSYLRIIKAGHAFPHKWEYIDDCEYVDPESGSACMNGHIQVQGDEGMKDVKCANCHGTGKAKSASPLGVYQVKAPNQLNTGSSADINIPPFGWVAPDPAIMEFLRKETVKNEEKALSILNLRSTTDVKGGDVALTRQIDREESFSTIQPISNQIFELYRFSHKCIIEMAYGVGEELPAISEPKNWAIRNEQELTLELAEAKKNGLPEIAIRKILEEYLITRFNSQEETIKAVNLTFYADRLICLSSQEIAQKKLSMAVANWEDILHTSIYTFIAEARIADHNFFEKTIDQQKEVLVQKAKAKESEIAPKKLDTESILTNVNGG